jgi:hypothetical protein
MSSYMSECLKKLAAFEQLPVSTTILRVLRKELAAHKMYDQQYDVSTTASVSQSDYDEDRVKFSKNEKSTDFDTILVQTDPFQKYWDTEASRAYAVQGISRNPDNDVKLARGYILKFREAMPELYAEAVEIAKEVVARNRAD